jgi:hypothetical protein
MVYFHNPKSQFGYILEGHGIEKCWYILWPLRALGGIFYGHLVIVGSLGICFPRFGIKKNLATLAAKHLMDGFPCLEMVAVAKV